MDIMSRKALTEILGIKYPILLAPMAGVSTPELAAAVSNSGGLGSLGLGSSSVEQARKAILETRSLTDKPFQVNFFCQRPEPLDNGVAERWIEYLAPIFETYESKPKRQLKKLYNSFVEDFEMLKMVLDTKPTAVSFHFGIPSKDALKALKEAGIITMVSVTQLSEAKIALDAGVDILVAQGIEAGGHRGMFNATNDPGISTSDLVRLLRNNIDCSIDVPIVAAGGIMSGKDINDVMSLGAAGAQLGTAFVQCKESAANETFKKLLFEPGIVTQITDSVSGRPARSLLNSWHVKVDLPTRPPHPGYPYTYDLGKQLNSAASASAYKDGSYGAMWAGTNVNKIRDRDAKELMKLLIDEMMISEQ